MKSVPSRIELSQFPGGGESISLNSFTTFLHVFPSLIFSLRLVTFIVFNLPNIHSLHHNLGLPFFLNEKPSAFVILLRIKILSLPCTFSNHCIFSFLEFLLDHSLPLIDPSLDYSDFCNYHPHRLVQTSSKKFFLQTCLTWLVIVHVWDP